MLGRIEEAEIMASIGKVYISLEERTVGVLAEVIVEVVLVLISLDGEVPARSGVDAALIHDGS
jgi:hypothetical protein